MLLLWLSGAFLTGVVTGTTFSVPGAAAVGVAGILAIAAGLLRHAKVWLLPLLLAALCLGFWRSPHQRAATSSDLRFYDGRAVQIQGVVDAEPDIRDTGANYFVTAGVVTVGSRTIAVSGRLQVHTSSAVLLDYGEKVSLRGRLLSPGASLSASFRDALARQGVFSEMRYPRLVDLGPSDRGIPGRIVLLRLRIEQGINRWLPEPEAALLIAIVLGAKSASLGDLAPALVSTGLIHLIAISGIKVALIAGLIHQFVKSLFNRFVALAVALGVLWFYVLLTGTTASGVRSAIMWSLVFIAVALGRGTVALVSLGLAAAVMVGIDPSLPWDIGFQLSVVGTFAIVAFTGPLQRPLRWVPSPWRQTLAVTLAAQIGTVPIVAIGFHVLSLSGPPANMLVLPLLPFLILLGLLLGILAAIPSVAAPLSALAYVLLRAVILLARWLSGAVGSVPAASIAPGVVLGYYAVLVVLATRILRRVHWTPVAQWSGLGRELAIAGVIGASALTVTLVNARDNVKTRLDWLGTGDSMLLRSGKTSILVDGSSHPFALLERLGDLLPAARHSIDVVVLTDPRARNVAGLTAVLNHYSVGEVLDVGTEYPSTTYVHWRTLLRADRVPVFSLRTGASIRIGDTSMNVIGPDALYPDPRDCVGLLRVSLAGKTYLLVGAASAREQQEAIFRHVDLHADALVASGPLRADFVDAVHPRVVLDAVASTGTAGLRRLSSTAEVQLGG